MAIRLNEALRASVGSTDAPNRVLDDSVCRTEARRVLVGNLTQQVDSTSVTSPRRARIFWKFSGRSSRLVDVARALFQIAPVSRD